MNVERQDRIEPYAAGLAVGRPPANKLDVRCRWIAVLDTRREGRGLRLIHPFTRVVRQGEIHEIVCTDESGARPAATVDSVATWGFAEFETGGVLMVGDRVVASDREIGILAGFDETHVPNHINIVVRAATRRSGAEMQFRPGDAFVFVGP